MQGGRGYGLGRLPVVKGRARQAGFIEYAKNSGGFIHQYLPEKTEYLEHAALSALFPKDQRLGNYRS